MNSHAHLQTGMAAALKGEMACWCVCPAQRFTVADLSTHPLQAGMAAAPCLREVCDAHGKLECIA